MQCIHHRNTVTKQITMGQCCWSLIIGNEAMSILITAIVFEITKKDLVSAASEADGNG